MKWEMESGGQSSIVLIFYLILVAFNLCIYLLVHQFFIYPFQHWLSTFNIEYCVPDPVVIYKETEAQRGEATWPKSHSSGSGR